MCGRHWGRVHPRLQRLVYRYYRPGQCDDKSPSVEWHNAADAAIGYVAVLEDQILRVSEMNALDLAGFGVEEHEGKLKAVFRGDA
jgi:hypothetical protein